MKEDRQWRIPRDHSSPHPVELPAAGRREAAQMHADPQEPAYFTVNLLRRRTVIRIAG